MQHPHTAKSRTWHLVRRQLAVVAGLSIFAFALFVGVNSFDARQTNLSPEVKFTDVSANGMQIVPASCPSSPHYAGECSACTISASPSTILEGQSTTLTWATPVLDPIYTASGSISPTVGAVAGSGSTAVTPSVTTTYTYSGTYYFGGAPTASTYTCATTVTVNALPPAAVTNLTVSTPAPGTSATLTWTASPGATNYYINVNNKMNAWGPTLCNGTINDGNTNDLCYASTAGTSYTFPYCIPGSDYWAVVYASNSGGTSAGTVIDFSCRPGPVTNLTASCPAPGTAAILNWTAVSGATNYYINVNNKMNAWGPTLCNGTINDGNTNDLCYASTAGTSYTFPYGIGGSDYWAVVYASNSGGVSTSTAVDFSCVSPCADSYFCQGNDLMHQDTACNNTVSLICSYGCSAGACIVPNPTINLSVTPLLLQKGEMSQVVWSTTDMSSCTVTSNNGASWSGLSGSQTSPAIQMQTIFTVRCTSVMDTTVSQAATVNIIPVFCEPGTPEC